ncbi:hypothetical protein ACFZB5_13790 [Streptomyces nodosus]|uniref:hypothetical protein n=1 Tax=Streptomyces nodosus TaxID=40318 RepID=UPI0036E064A0
MTDQNPADELRAAARTLRDTAPDIHGPLAPLADPVADWLDHAADGLNIGRIHGTDLVICEPCCEQLPCQHLKPVLAVARAVNGTQST